MFLRIGGLLLIIYAIGLYLLGGNPVFSLIFAALLIIMSFKSKN